MNVVDQLFENSSSTFIKPTIMQKDIDAAKQKVEALPESPQKQQLLQKVNEAFNQLQEFTFKGLNNFNFATFDVTHGVATLRTNAGKPHPYTGNTYASITIKREQKVVFDKKYIGYQNYLASVNTFNLKDGDKVTIFHKAATSGLIVNHPDLKPNNSGTYNYTVKNGQLALD